MDINSQYNTYLNQGNGYEDFGGDYGNDPGYAAWAQQAQSYKSMYVRYLQQLSQNGIDTSEQSAYQTVMGYLNQINEWLGMSPGMDSMMGDELGGGFGIMGEDGGMGFEGGQPSVNSGVQPTYQDQQKVLFEDEVSDFTGDKSMPQSEAHFYDYGAMSFNVPSSAKVKVVQQTDGALKATVTWPDGKTKDYYFHNNKKVTFVAGDAERQIDIGDVTITAGKVAKKDKGAEGEEAAQGTPPDENDAHTWSKNDSVDYVVTEGTETDKINADNVNITLPDRSHTAEVTKMAGPPTYYLVEIYDGSTPPKLVRKIEVRQAEFINFNRLDGDNMKFKDLDADPADTFHTWSDEDHDVDSHITLGGVKDGEATEDGSGVSTTNDTKPDDKTTATWTYDNSDTVDVNAVPNGVHTESIINDATNVVIHATKDQLVTVYKEGENYIVEVQDKKDPTKKLKFTIDGRHLKKPGGLDIQAPAKNITYTEDVEYKSKLYVNGKPAYEDTYGLEEIGRDLESTAITSFDDAEFQVTGWDHATASVDWAKDAMKSIGKGLETGDWNELKEKFEALINASNSGATSNHYKQIRFGVLFQILRGYLGKQSGGNKEKVLKAIFGQMDSDVRDLWAQGLNKEPSLTNKHDDWSHYKGSWVTDLDSSYTYQTMIELINGEGSSDED